jgi:cysteine-rich repeat protein
MRIVSNVPFVLAVALFGGCILGESQQSDESTVSIARLAGAIFTTLPDGTRVDANIYADKDDVYLDGGPGNQAPSGSAALPEGDYYFQVTDPSGQTLLSQDAIECRRFHVDASGLISAVGPSGCSHVTGIDVDHGALTVQLMPYADTPNPGGEYKAWVTKVSEYDIRYRQFFGFKPSESKTDNYKIREEEELPPPPPAPYCGDGNLDAGEECDDGNNVNGDGCSATCCNENNPPPPPPPVCGDGHLDAGEQCDDGNTANGDGCDAHCVCEPGSPTSDPTEGGSGTITDPIIVEPLKDRVIFHSDSIFEYELSSGSLY